MKKCTASVCTWRQSICLLGRPWEDRNWEQEYHQEQKFVVLVVVAFVSCDFCSATARTNLDGVMLSVDCYSLGLALAGSLHWFLQSEECTKIAQKMGSAISD